jgi:Maltokinase N-terminal cap domain
MAIFYPATLTPTKAAIIAGWVPTQPWGPPADAPIVVLGSFRFDDPDGRVGLETHMVDAGGTLLHVPLTYRDEPLDGADDALIGEMDHSVLGTRWVYDGMHDPLFVIMLAAVALTGQGEAIGMVVYDDRCHIAPSNVRIKGGGWSLERVAVDGFEIASHDATSLTLHNDRFEMTVYRRPVPGPQPAIGLTATWDGQQDVVVLAEVSERAR